MVIELLPSLLGVVFFSLIMIYGYRYADGKHKVSESGKEKYMEWVAGSGKTIKKAIIIISILYGAAMLFQIYGIMT